MNRSAKWRALADSLQKSQRSSVGRSSQKFRPKLNPNETKKQRSFMVSSMHDSRSRISMQGNQASQKRGTSFKESFVSRRKQMHNSESQVIETTKLNRQSSLKRTYNESELRQLANEHHKSPKAELDKIKKQFFEFQSRVLKQLQKLQQYIEKYMGEISQKVGITNFPSFSSVKINLKHVDFPPADKNQRIEKITPLRSRQIGHKMVYSPQRVKKSQSFNKFFETIAKLKNDVKNLGEISMIKEKVIEKDKLRQVKSDKNLIRGGIK